MTTDVWVYFLVFYPNGLCTCFDCETMLSWSTQLYSILKTKCSNVPFLTLFLLKIALVVGQEAGEWRLYFHTNSKIASITMKNATDILIGIDCWLFYVIWIFFNNMISLWTLSFHFTCIHFLHQCLIVFTIKIFHFSQKLLWIRLLSISDHWLLIFVCWVSVFNGKLIVSQD